MKISIHRTPTPAEQALTRAIAQAHQSGDDTLVNVLLIEKTHNAQQRQQREAAEQEVSHDR